MDSERFPAPVGLTGDPRVDDAIAGLAALGERPLEEHPPVLAAAHDSLREILGELGEPGEPGRPGQQGRLGEDDGQGSGGPGQGGDGGRR